MNFCPNCGSKLPEGAIFCEECGVRIAAEAEPVQRKSYKGLTIGLAVLVFVLLLAIVCLLLGNDDSSELSEPAGTQEHVGETQEDSANEDTVDEPKDTVTITVDKGDSEEEQEKEDGFRETAGTVKPVDMNRIQDIYATSSLPENDMVHVPERMLDQNKATAWIEGADGLGIHESVTICFEEEGLITIFDICPGFQKSKDLYLKNSRPAKIRLTFADGSTFEQVVMDVIGEHSLNLKEPVVTDRVTITILEVYEGTKYQDTAISEIGFR